MHAVRTAALVLLVSATGAAAQDKDPRFTIEKSADGYVRMDTVTGEMSICVERAGALSCRLADDERSELQDKVARMSRRLDAIEKRLAEIGTPQSTQNALPTDEQFEQSLSLMERFLRRFIGVVKDLEEENRAPAAPAQKT